MHVKRNHATTYPNPKPGPLTKDKTEQYYLFQVIGVDYAGPVSNRSKTSKYFKAYILLFSCSQKRKTKDNLFLQC